MRGLWIATVLVLLALPSPRAGAQVFGASGAEFQVNTTTTGNQYGSAVGIDAYGKFFVTWMGPDGDNTGSFGRRFEPNGSPIDPLQFRINSNTTGRVDHVGAAGHASGGFVVVWERMESNGNVHAFGQRYDAAGELGGPFQADSSTPGDYPNPAVASDDLGDFVVVWQGPFLDGVTEQRYNSQGTPLGATSSSTKRWRAISSRFPPSAGPGPANTSSSGRGAATSTDGATRAPALL